MRVTVDPVTGELLNDIDHDDVYVAASVEAWVEISEDLERRIVSAV
jgi:hypothetical protein